jgi:hypothetical protein
MTTSSPELGLPASVADKLHATKDAVQAKAGGFKQSLRKGGKTVQGKAAEATLPARSAANEALAKLPAPVSSQVGQLAGTVRQRPVGAAAVLLGVLVLLVLGRFLRGSTES